MARPAPISPCINICALDEQGYCLGCYRSLEEIAGWSRLSAVQQWAIMDQLPGRAERIDALKPIGETK